MKNIRKTLTILMFILIAAALAFASQAQAAPAEQRPATKTPQSTPTPTPSGSDPTPTPSGGGSEPTSGNLVANGDFSGGMTGWGWYVSPAAMAYRSIQNGEIYVQIPDDGDYEYHIQVNKPNLTIVKGRTYALYFDARTDGGTRSIGAYVGMMEKDWQAFGFQTFNITSTKTRYSFTFTMDKNTEFLSQVSFQLGGPGAALQPGVYLDNIALYDLTGGTVPKPTAMPTPASIPSNLVWSDEFNGSAVDTSNWTFDIGRGMNGWGNQELQYYTEQNATVANGLLTITAKKESYKGASYTSSRLKTLGKREFLYGRIEMRAKLPYGQGIWPAFWTLGHDIETVGWPKCGEIDILEMVGGGSGGDSSELRDDTAVTSLHYEQTDGNHWNHGSTYTLGTGILNDGFHTYSIVWDENYIYTFIDGVQYGAQQITDANRYDEFHKRHFILLNLAVGGVWPGYPDKYTTFPQVYQIDYVRVYQK
ncbi:MAG: family 16 glycosylhydrolase [Bacteroidetes bacterium]|nr:family 16 glycosylhydrolase [Bacteroidota bacterium]